MGVVRLVADLLGCVKDAMPHLDDDMDYGFPKRGREGPRSVRGAPNETGDFFSDGFELSILAVRFPGDELCG